ncbi:hypothetical protein ACM16X_14545 [Haloarcula japonica]|uniref:hypothetical protein n=1 Tax=Haloarcula japonica TaxID=29282 RepID=UPI0039F7222C
MIPVQLVYIIVGALFSAIATLALTTYKEYKQSVRTRRVLFAEMESMKDLLERTAEEDRYTRPIRLQIEQQISTKMYDQHLPNLGRLTDDEIGAVMSFYKNMEYITQAHQVYNQSRVSEDLPDMDSEKFDSYMIKMSAERALLDLRAAQYFRGDINYIQYLWNWRR